MAKKSRKTDKEINDLDRDQFNVLPKWERRAILVKAERDLNKAIKYAEDMLPFQKRTLDRLRRLVSMERTPTIPKKNRFTGTSGLPTVAFTSTKDDGEKDVHFGLFSTIPNAVLLAATHSRQVLATWQNQRSAIREVLRSDELLFPEVPIETEDGSSE